MRGSPGPVADHRDDLVAERTRVINRLRRHLHEPDSALVERIDDAYRECEIRRRCTSPRTNGGPVGGMATVKRRGAYDLCKSRTSLGEHMQDGQHQRRVRAPCTWGDRVAIDLATRPF